MIPLACCAVVQSGLAKNARLKGEVELPYLRVANVQDGYLDLSEVKTVRLPADRVERYRLREGDVLLTEGGDFDKLGRGTVWNGEIEPCLHQNHVFAVRVDHEQLTPRFLSALTGSAYGKDFFLNSSKQTTNLASINKSQLRSFPVLLPPLPEQKKIAVVLSSVDEAIQATQAVLEQTRRVKEGLLQDLLLRGIGHTQSKQCKVGDSPEAWTVRTLGDIAEVRSGLAKNSKRVLADPVEVAYLRVANVQDGYLDLSEVKSIQLERARLGRYRLQPGDVLLNEGGDIDKLGRGDVWEGQIDPCVHQNHVFSVRCGPLIRPRYLAFILESSLGKAYFRAKGKQTTNLASINKTQVRGLPVPLPTVAEQDVILERLGSVRSALEALEKEVEGYAALKAGLLQDLLTGKVRVAI